MRGLNKCFLTSVQKLIEIAPEANFTKLFDQYKNHLASFEEPKKQVAVSSDDFNTVSVKPAAITSSFILPTGAPIAAPKVPEAISEALKPALFGLTKPSEQSVKPSSFEIPKPVEAFKPFSAFETLKTADLDLPKPTFNTSKLPPSSQQTIEIPKMTAEPAKQSFDTSVSEIKPINPVFELKPVFDQAPTKPFTMFDKGSMFSIPKPATVDEPTKAYEPIEPVKIAEPTEPIKSSEPITVSAPALFSFGTASSSTPASAPAPAPALFSFGATAPSISTSTSAFAPASTSGFKPFSFGSSESSAPAFKPFSFGAPANESAPAPLFSFGASSTAPALPTFSFGSTSATNGFSFSAPSAAAAATTTEQQSGGEDDEIPAEEAESFNLTRTNSEQLKTGAGEENETSQYEERCKVFMMDRTGGNGWIDLGVGTFKINRYNNETGKSRVLCRAEGSGKVILNTLVNVPGMDVTTIEGKKEVALLVIGPEGLPTKYLIRVKTLEQAVALKTALLSEIDHVKANKS